VIKTPFRQTILRRAPALLALLAAGAVTAGCDDSNRAKKPDAPNAAGAPSSAKTPAPKTPPAAFAKTAAELDPDTDPVLGWWRCADADADPEQTRTSKLWPTTGDDRRALRTIRFMNDCMATNGCCAGAAWEFAAPHFYKVERGISELYYAPDASTLYFLGRREPEAAGAAFKKIIAAVTAAAAVGKSPEALLADGTLDTLAKFTRQRAITPGGM
jgi:hypothetical protein